MKPFGKFASVSAASAIGRQPTQTHPAQSDQDAPLASIASRRLARFLVCLAIFAVLVAWLLIFRWTGDGDSVGHYLNLRETPRDPTTALYAWCRPLFVLIMFLPAKFGIVAVRMWSAIVTCITAWVTMRLADRLKLPNATLAGPLLVLQPLVFALASDTMTEITMALGLAIAIHLWWSRQWAWSAVLISFLPMARPEGFFFAAMWGVMLLANRNGGSIIRRCFTALLLAAGMIAWMAAGQFWAGNWKLFYDFWSWPAGGYPYYPRGTLLHHVILWPYYCGIVLIVLYVAGIKPSWNRAMALPWAMWLIVFVVHSILFWKGWFASAGLMRIMACTSPVTALVCLYGWNRISAGKWAQDFSPQLRRVLAGGIIAVATAWAMVSYVLVPSNLRTFGLTETAHYIADHHLIEGVPGFFAADEIIFAEMGLENYTPGIIHHSWGKSQQLAMLATLPIGTIGEWDNQRGMEWYQTDIDEVVQQGYQVIHMIEHPIIHWQISRWDWPLSMDVQKYAVLRKIRAATRPG